MHDNAINLADRLIDNINERNTRIRMYTVQKYMCGIAYHHQKIGTGILEPLRHSAKGGGDIRRSFSYGTLPVRYGRVLVDDHVDMILVVAGIRQRDNLGHEIHSGIRTHAPQHPRCFSPVISHRCASRI